MPTKYICPAVHRQYAYQPTLLTCWAAAGLTLWRTRFGADGRGANIHSLVQAPAGNGMHFAKILEFAGEVVVAMGDSMDLNDLPQAEREVRAVRPEFENVSSGLPDKLANEFFTSVLATRSTGIDAKTTRNVLMALIRRSAPLAIFTRRPGHVKLIIGFREVDAGDPQSPQIVMFDPETYLLATENGAHNGESTTRRLHDEFVPWTQWQASYVNNLVDSKCWHY